MAYLKKYNSLIRAIINIFSDNLIGIAISGSRSLFYIKKPRDLEIRIFLKQNSLDKDSVEFFRLKQEYKNKNISIMAESFEIFGPKVPAFIYLEHFYKPLYGQVNNTYNILENKKDYYEALKYWTKIKYNITTKYFYHILTGIYILENNSYEFTKTQINNINILHDMTDLTTCNSLINWIYYDYFRLGE